MASSGSTLQDGGQVRSPRIVISYRRGDTNADAGRLFDYLAPVFGKERVFMDIDTIQPGDDFVEAIERAVDASDAIVAVIGPRWLEGLDEPRDFVRFEIATAMKLHKRVIPVLVADAEMPPPDMLPKEISSLSRLHAINVSHLHFRSDAERLVEALRRQFSSSMSASLDRGVPRASRATARSAPPLRLRARKLLAGVGILIAIGVVGLFVPRVWDQSRLVVGNQTRQPGTGATPERGGSDDPSGHLLTLKPEPYADLEGQNLQHVYLVDHDLHHAHMKQADLSRAFLDRASLHDSDLNGARLVSARLQGADLSRANLRDADLQDADLQGANLEDADVEGADLRSVRHVTCVQLRRAKNWTLAVRDTATLCGNAAGVESEVTVAPP
jgi:hypothetical protein